MGEEGEHEFGVPIPGEVLAEEKWAKTAVKRVPEGKLDWGEMFGRTAPVVLDLGCGNGRFTLGSALRRPEVDHLAVDVLPVVIRYATRRANHRGLANTRWAVIGGRELLADKVPAGSAAEVHVYHPQPYYKRVEVGKRLVTPEFLRLAHQALAPGGRLFVQTDHPAYWRYMQQVLPVFFDFTERSTPWPDSPRGRREILAQQQGLKIFRGEGTVKPNLDVAQALQLAARLPAPTFNADRRMQELDRLERQG